jgi:hypothetical protein
VLRRAASVIAVMLIASGLAAGALGLGSSTSPTGGQPATTSAPNFVVLARQFADRLATSKNQRVRYQTLLAVMRALNVGVRTPKGRAIVQGAERRTHHFYLYDFEVRMLAAALGQRRHVTAPRIARQLSLIGVRPGGKSLTGKALANALAEAIRVSSKRKHDPLSLAPLIVRELSLRRRPPRDPSMPQTAATIGFDALQQWLIIADTAMPAMTRPSKPPPRQLALGAGQTRCSAWSVKAAGKNAGWSAGRIFKVLKWFRRGKKLTVPIEAGLHAVLLGSVVEISPVADVVGPAHWGHESAGPRMVFQVKVVMTASVPEELCGQQEPLFSLPRQGPIPRVPISWDYSEPGVHKKLTEHGRVECAGCGETNGQGIATLAVHLRKEVMPGIGPEIQDSGLVTALAHYQTPFKNTLGWLVQFVTPKWDSIRWFIDFHRPRGFKFTKLEWELYCCDGGRSDLIQGVLSGRICGDDPYARRWQIRDEWTEYSPGVPPANQVASYQLQFSPDKATGYGGFGLVQEWRLVTNPPPRMRINFDLLLQNSPWMRATRNPVDAPIEEDASCPRS